MKNTIVKYAIYAFAWLAVLYPLITIVRLIEWGQEPVLEALFPLFGITAFALLWLHSLSGVFEEWLRRYIDFDWFVSITASIILLCILMHPLLLLAMFGFNIMGVFASYGVLYIALGIAGWALLIIYDLVKPWKRKYDFFARHWNKVLIISNIGFVLTFFHSLYIGSDLQSGPLRMIWIFYGVTAIIALIYTYLIKRLLQKQN